MQMLITYEILQQSDALAELVTSARDFDKRFRIPRIVVVLSPTHLGISTLLYPHKWYFKKSLCTNIQRLILKLISLPLYKA